MIAPTVDDLQAITEQVWLSYLDPEGTDPLLPLPVEAPAAGVAASVSVTGAWDGHVVFTCSREASLRAASALLGVPADEVTADDVADAVGELVNVIGGNVKSLLPDGCLLSLPHVVTGEAAASGRWPAAVEVCRLQGVWGAEPVAVGVWASKTTET
ncbi:chemotaxis protein CheX [Actinomadura hibisca]|uniref:chemotaxis protein CheX n=1 Tax=Actinomadura hibisca TaxID=68565 RepID=UPI00082FD64E|nr:chemotaxis protein CheX [Actinomadura hibisca]